MFNGAFPPFGDPFNDLWHGFISEGVEITANFFAPTDANATGVLLAAAKGVRLSSNVVGGHAQEQPGQAMAVAAVGSDPSFFWSERINIEGNIGWSHSGGPLRQLPRLLSGVDGGMGLASVSSDLVQPRNFATLNGGCCDWKSLGVVVIGQQAFDGRPVVQLLTGGGDCQAPGPKRAASATILSVPLESTPSLAGQLVYFAVKASVTATTRTDASFGLLIDRGDGQWLHSCSSVAAHHPTVGCLRFAPSTTPGEQPGWEGWTTVQFETALLTSGTARFGIEARGLCGNSTAHVLAAETAAAGRGAAVVVAPVGAPWSGALKG